MEPPIPLKSVVLFIACGTMVFVIVFIFAKRQITRFTLKSSRAPHATIGADAPKALRQEIERRLKRVADIGHEPHLLSTHVEDSVSATFNGEPCFFIYRMKAVDALSELDTVLREYSPHIKRTHAVQALRPFLLELRQGTGPLAGIKLDVIKKFADCYDHARHDPQEFKQEHYQEYMDLLHHLTQHILNKKNLTVSGAKLTLDDLDKPVRPNPIGSSNPSVQEQQANQQEGLLLHLNPPANQGPDGSANQQPSGEPREEDTEEVTYRPRKRKPGSVKAPLGMEATSTRDSGGSSSIASEEQSEMSMASSLPESNSDVSGGALRVRRTTTGESVV